jgi:uncharacterized membrane protein
MYLMLKHLSYGRLRVICTTFSGCSSKKAVKEERPMEYFRPHRQNSTVYLTLLAILTALTTVATLVLIIPFPTTSGYFNLGDVLVMMSGFLLGPVGGFIAGGVGSAIADMIVAPAYAPITFVAKGLEGMFVGLLSAKTLKETRIRIRDVSGVILASCAMMLGYLLGEIFILEYSFGAALAELVTVNSIQVIVGSLVTLSIGPLIRSYLRSITYDGETSLDVNSGES